MQNNQTIDSTTGNQPSSGDLNQNMQFQQQQWMNMGFSPEMQFQGQQWNPMMQMPQMFPQYQQQFPQQQKKPYQGDFFVRKSKEEQQLETQQYQQMFDPQFGYFPPFMRMGGFPGQQMPGMPGMPFGYPMMPPQQQQFQEQFQENQDNNQEEHPLEQDATEEKVQSKEIPKQKEDTKPEQGKESYPKRNKQQNYQKKYQEKQGQKPYRQQYAQQKQQQPTSQPEKNQTEQKQSQKSQNKPSRFRVDSDTFPQLPVESKQQKSAVVYKMKEQQVEKKIETKEEEKVPVAEQNVEKIKSNSEAPKIVYSTEQIQKYFGQLKQQQEIKLNQNLGTQDIKDLPILLADGCLQLEVIEPSKTTIRKEEKFEFQEYKPSKKKESFDKSKLFSRHKYSLQLPVYERKEQK